MKKLLLLLLVWVLLSVQINYAVSNPQNNDSASGNKAVQPKTALDMPEKSNFFHIAFRKVAIPQLPTSNNHVQRVYLYANNYDNARIFIMDEKVSSESTAMKILLQQATARGNYKPQIKQYKDVQYIEGTDMKMNGRYIIVLDYNKATKRAMIRSLMYQKKPKNRDFFLIANSVKETQLVDELLHFGRNL